MAIKVADNFSYLGAKPLDARLQFATVTDMVASPVATLYDGCFAYVKGTKKYYSFDSTNDVDVTLGKWREYENSGSVVKSVYYGYLKEADGKFYADSAYTTEIAGAEDTLYVTKDTDKTYRYDSTNGFVLVGGGDGETIQYDTMPTADSDHLGKIIQYIGATTTDYTNGLFYKCVADGAGYKWENIPTSEASGHTIKDESGTSLADRKNLQFKGASVTDDSTNDVTIVEVDGVQKNILPTASADNLGKVYQFLGTTGTYKHGRFYECVTDGTSYSWGEVEVSEDTVIQFAALPVASVDQLGAIYQYTGATSGNLTNGYFYECVLDGSTYKWTEKRVESPEVETISKADFDALTPAERNNGKAYFIPDADILTDFTVMGNRFDKANIYTADERMIGSWMGKPLYQRTFTFAEPITVPNNSWYRTGISIENCERIIDGKAYNLTGAFSAGFGYDSSELIMQITRYDGAVVVYSFTIQYTKTTDATVSIGTGNDYSTDEQIIGTWFDGKPLYQKTINFGALPNNAVKDTTIATANTILVKHCFGYALRTDDGMSIELPRSNPTLSNNISVDIIENQSKIRLTTGGDYSTFAECYITIQYTKNTD